MQRRWCLGEGCICDDGRAAVDNAVIIPINPATRPVLHAALFGGASGSEFTATLQPVEDACALPVPANPFDSCLVGKWNPDPAEFQDFILTSYRRALPGLTGVTLLGTIDLTFEDGGEFQQIYNGVTGSATFAGENYVLVWTGGTAGTWETSGGVMTLTFTSNNIVATVNNVGAGGFRIPTSSVDAEYTCSGDTLVINAPPDAPNEAWPIPENWTKVP